MPRPTPATGARRWRPSVSALLLGGLLAAQSVAAQDIVRAATPWRTLHTRWFDVHYPLDTERWALDLAPQLDAVRDSVAALVGYAPPGRTTIVIDDPYNQANGKAIPILGAPLIHLWVTPPGPTDQIANHRGWGVKLAAHEFGHIAHLSRPVRGRSQPLWHLLPAQVSPIVAFTPTWAIEGYATWIEGKVTGTGRPHGVWRPALLRELALAGRLPGYAAMSGGGGYKGGSMAYLAGSAFWEWLAAQRGDTSMTLVFRRQTARTKRSFDEAFRGVYGDAPATMFARFSAELTAKAFAVDTALRERGLVTGTRLARFAGAVGSPAVTRDGKRLALSLPGTGGRPPRVIVTRADTQVVTPQEKQAQLEIIARDSQDVPAIRIVPRLATALATLTPRHGRSFRHPRFIDSAGTQLLLESWSVRRDGTQRPDLATWNTRTGVVRFVTDGAGVRDADPSPDGTRAVAIRCSGGTCDVVLVSMATGAITTLAAGSPRTVYSQPRWSPDGRSVVMSVQASDGLWRLAVSDVAGGTLRIVTPDDDVNRHTASFDAAGAQLVYVSEADGIPNVESLQLADGVRTARTRVAGSVYDPVPLPNGGVLFLVEYAGGMDLHRLDGVVPVPGEALGATAMRLAPAMPQARERGMALPAVRVGAPVRYVTGPRTVRFTGSVSAARDGRTAGFSVVSVDPANRLAWTLTALLGSHEAWRGGTASAAWYGSRPTMRGEVAWLQQDAGAQRSANRVSADRVSLGGGSLSLELPIAGSSKSHRATASAFVGAAERALDPVASRTVLTAQYGVGGVVAWRVSAGGSVRGTIGRLGGDQFVRGTAAAYLSVRGARLDARMHRSSAETPLFEQFSAGGFAPPLADEATLSQRIGVPALPVGTARGREMYEWRATYPMPLAPLGTLYAHAVGTAWRPDRESLVVGAEQGFALDYLGIVGLPRMRALAGAGYVARGPLRRSGSAYLSFTWRP